jgi:hypothetical protein
MNIYYVNIFLKIFQTFRKNYPKPFSNSQRCRRKEKKNTVAPKEKLKKKNSVAPLEKRKRARDANEPYCNPTVDRIFRIQGPSPIRMNLRPKVANDLRTMETPGNQSRSVHEDDIPAIEELPIDKSERSGSPTTKVLKYANKLHPCCLNLLTLL